MMSLTKQFMALQIRSIMKLQKLCAGVYLTNSLTHWPQCHCDTKVSIKTMWGQSVIMTLQLLAADWYRWRHNRSIALYTLKSWAVAEWNVDLCYFSDRNHISDRYTEYMELIMFGRYYEISTRHLSFSGDSGYFSQFWYRIFTVYSCLIINNFNIEYSKYISIMLTIAKWFLICQYIFPFEYRKTYSGHHCFMT